MWIAPSSPSVNFSSWVCTAGIVAYLNNAGVGDAPAGMLRTCSRAGCPFHRRTATGWVTGIDETRSLVTKQDSILKFI